VVKSVGRSREESGTGLGFDLFEIAGAGFFLQQKADASEKAMDNV
jgi:hypothetical protein